MVKVQIDLSKDEDRLVEMYKLLNNQKTKQEAIKKIIMQLDGKIKLVKDEEYFK